MRSETGFDPDLYQRFPTQEERPPEEEEELRRIWCAPRGWEYLTVVNNNYVGIFYLGTAFLFFLLAGVLALLMRVQLSAPLMEVLPQATYNQVFTMHGTVMMFLFAVPMVEAAGVLLLPQMLAARDLPFPRLSAYAFWAYAVGGLAFFASLFVGLAPDGGWFMYPPFTSKAYSPGINADFWLLGIGFIEISAIAGAIEIIVGVLRTRAPGMSLDRMPIFAWAMLVFAVMIIIAFPSVILATLLLEIERAFNWPFFDAARGGDPVLWQHLFWFFGHPEVYIIFLPAAGMMSMIVPTVAKAELVGYRLIVLAMIATGFISFGVWAHHMFTVGLPPMTTGFFSAASMAVSLPACIQVFSWIATLAIGRPRFNAPGLFVLGSIVIFVTGGLTGVMVALVPFDWQAHDTYFIVAHLHYVLIGGMVFPLFAAMYYWIPMVSSRAMSERLAKWVFGLMFTGMNVAFMPMHLVGLMGMPRRVYTYLPGSGWDMLNLISTIGAFLFAFGVLLFLIERADFRQGRDKTVFPAADAVPQLHMKLHELGDPLARRRLSQCLFCRRLHQGDGLGINRNDQLILARKIIGNAGGIEPDCPRNLGQGGRLDAGFVDEHRCRVNDRAAFFAKLLRHIGLLCHPIPHPNRLQQVPLPVQWGRRGNPQRMLPMSRRSLRVPF